MPAGLPGRPRARAGLWVLADHVPCPCTAPGREAPARGFPPRSRVQLSVLLQPLRAQQATPAQRPSWRSSSFSARVTPARAAVGTKAARITLEAGSSEARGRWSRLLNTPLGQRDREMLQLEALEGRKLAGQPRSSPFGGPHAHSPSGGLLGQPARSSQTRRRDLGGTRS